MLTVRDAYIALLEKTAATEDSSRVALQEYVSNQADQRNELISLLDHATSAEKTDAMLVKSVFRGSNAYESGNPLLKVAEGITRDIITNTIDKRAPAHFKEAMVASFSRELDKIAVMVPPSAVPASMLPAKATEASPYAIKGAMNPKALAKRLAAKRTAASAAKVVKPGLLGRAVKAIGKAVT